MKIPLDYKSWYLKIKQNVSVVLLVVLAILLLSEIWTVKNAWSVLSDSSNTQLIVPVKLIRINFSTYEAINKRVQSANTYIPQPFVSKSPFGVNEKPDNSSGDSSTSTGQ